MNLQEDDRLFQTLSLRATQILPIHIYVFLCGISGWIIFIFNEYIMGKEKKCTI